MDMQESHPLLVPPRYAPAIMTEKAVRTYSYGLGGRVPGFHQDSGGNLLPSTVASYKLSSNNSKDTVGEQLRRGTTTYIPREALSQEALDEDIRIVQAMVEKGAFPEGTRRHMSCSPPWEWDHYQALAVEYKQQRAGTGPSLAQVVGECPGVDYQYARTPYRSHTGDMGFVSMHSYCAFENGERLPADRPAELRNKEFMDKLAYATRRMKRSFTACC